MVNGKILGIWICILLCSCSDPVIDVKVDCEETDLAIEVIKLVYADCGLSNGEITVSSVGGKTPYKYSIDGSALQSSPIFSKVPSGFRKIEVVDANNCKKEVLTFMGSKDPFQVVINTTPSGCDDSKGTITVQPLGGKPPYKYQLGENNDNYQLNNTWENLRSGQHSIWVEDDNKCFFGVYTYVSTGVSYSKTVTSIIETNCTTPSCHGGAQAPDFRNFTTIKANATKIKNSLLSQGTTHSTILSGEDIKLIVCWVNDGAVNN